MNTTSAMPHPKVKAYNLQVERDARHRRQHFSINLITFSRVGFEVKV